MAGRIPLVLDKLLLGQIADVTRRAKSGFVCCRANVKEAERCLGLWRDDTPERRRKRIMGVVPFSSRSVTGLARDAKLEGDGRQRGEIGVGVTRPGRMAAKTGFHHIDTAA